MSYYPHADRPAHRRRLTFGEIAAVIATLMLLAAVLFPVFARAPYRSGRYSCPSNLKQLGLAMAQYASDYDGMLPPPSLPRLAGQATHIDGFPAAADASPVLWQETLYPYVRSARLFRCPDTLPKGGGEAEFGYRYSDLLYGVARADIRVPARTVLAMDGEPEDFNIGHAYTPDTAPLPASLGRRGGVIPGFGATVRDAATRHGGGANYLLADGHVMRLKPTDVFFPPRAEMSRSHLSAGSRPVGPDPAGPMTFAGREYRVTFQLR